LDRLEVIFFPGYMESEKIRIAQDFLIPRQIKEHALTHLNVSFTPGAIAKIIRDYTREAGLRNLEREIATICRKLARIALETKPSAAPLEIDEALVERFLGPRKFTHEVAEAGNQVGVATGLVWTEFGGEIISVEATQMQGNKQLILTGSLGNVMQESAQTALSYLRSHAEDYGLYPGFFVGKDIHIHIPSGAIPKEGPSAGVTIALALLSLLTGRPARRDVALTGELTLSGRILPVSGIREKILAAQRAGARVVVFPKQNEVDIKDLEDDLKEGLQIVLADTLESLVDVVLLPG
jgi:ATP-dependent Lon protease